MDVVGVARRGSGESLGKEWYMHSRRQDTLMLGLRGLRQGLSVRA